MEVIINCCAPGPIVCALELENVDTPALGSNIVYVNKLPAWPESNYHVFFLLKRQVLQGLIKCLSSFYGN